jgi:glycine cleavage system aminomethyltransferase T
MELVAERGDFGELVISDISDAWSAVGLWGPEARSVLDRVTGSDVGNDAFPYFNSRWIDVGMAQVLALRVSYAGELGWELHMPVDAALQVWDTVWDAGSDLGLVVAGMGAFDSLRLEKGYRGWGSDVHTEYNAYEAGLGWTVRLDKPDFMGRGASERLSTKPPTRKLSCLVLDDGGVALGYEPIMDGATCVGYVTSGNYGYSVGSYIAYGYLPAEVAVEGRRLEVEYFGARVGATVAPDPLFDPKMERMRA